MPRLSFAGPLWVLPVMMGCLGLAFFVLEILMPRVWGFDPAVSPGWQVALHHLTLGIVFPAGFAVTWFSPVVSSLLTSRLVRALMLMAAPAVPALVFLVGWMRLGGWPGGFRDPVFAVLLGLSAGLLVCVWAVPVMAAMFGRALRGSGPGRCSDGANAA